MNTPHIQTYMTWLYQNGYGPYMDFANFHYYTGGDPSTTNGDTPSYDLEWQTIRDVQAANGDGAKPVWCTEVGWAISSVSQPGPIVSLAQQAQYLRYVLDSSRTSSVVQRVFIYMVSDTGYDGMNLYPPTGPLPSYTMLQDYVAQYPSWGASAPLPTWRRPACGTSARRVQPRPRAPRAPHRCPPEMPHSRRCTPQKFLRPT